MEKIDVVESTPNQFSLQMIQRADSRGQILRDIGPIFQNDVLKNRHNNHCVEA